ncbi:DNA cytosine methyltransferase [Vibrio mimicus]|uniref:DNA cytosine methyltransferase n=1 Tax=Vibrio mimicus TaxID=674 RepID=UPI00076B7D54|nr:DNA cytosine methyltransferase [Vibrio mimicus]AMG01502.1 DNA cytosine methyltransferase [Vibrio mimicus]KAA3493794.1 DNA cytosine methyltransferase [Vibrio mimicus]
MNQIKVIDLFSGPGGLGEGFTSVKNKNGDSVFKIATSIEKEPSAHQTLTLRSFFRQFHDVPNEYYEFLKGRLGETPSEKLYSLFPNEYEAASKETLCFELGKDNDKIIRAIQNAIGNDDCIIIGGPPCQAYSTVGVARNKGNKNYDPAKDHRNFLYKEYLAVIAKFQPKIFVMENVKGMLSAKVKGKLIYKDIFEDLKNPTKSSGEYSAGGRTVHSYRILSLVNEGENNLKPQDYVVKSELFGVPQNRHRVILLGIRDDVDTSRFSILEQSHLQTTVDDVIGDLPSLRSGLSKSDNNSINWIKTIQKETRGALRELKISHPDLVNTMKNEIGALSPALSQGSLFGCRRNPKIKNSLSEWYFDKKLGTYICNHETRGHIDSDLARYLFCSSWGKTYEKDNNFASPKSHDFPRSLVPAHKSFNTGKFADRFRVQLKGKPATTITSHISKDGHYYIHPDPKQCRSLTVREAARIQTFPDNYFFVGTRTQQYVQVGNAVPPLLANQIAKLVMKILNI